MKWRWVIVLMGLLLLGLALVFYARHLLRQAQAFESYSLAMWTISSGQEGGWGQYRVLATNQLLRMKESAIPFVLADLQANDQTSFLDTVRDRLAKYYGIYVPPEVPARRQERGLRAALILHPTPEGIRQEIEVLQTRATGPVQRQAAATLQALALKESDRVEAATGTTNR